MERLQGRLGCLRCKHAFSRDSKDLENHREKWRFLAAGAMVFVVNGF